jgi:hypothetical protein
MQQQTQFRNESPLKLIKVNLSHTESIERCLNSVCKIKQIQFKGFQFEHDWKIKGYLHYVSPSRGFALLCVSDSYHGLYHKVAQRRR